VTGPLNILTGGGPAYCFRFNIREAALQRIATFVYCNRQAVGRSRKFSRAGVSQKYDVQVMQYFRLSGAYENKRKKDVQLSRLLYTHCTSIHTRQHR